MTKKNSNRRRSRKVNAAQRKRSNARNSVQYENLEPRQLLTADIALQFSGAGFGVDSSSVISNVQGDAGFNHYVEVTEGAVIIHDEATGTRVSTTTLDEFFVQAGANVRTPLHDPQIIFDQQENRWFIAANGEGGGNEIHFAVSATADPTGVWDALQFVGDSQGISENGDVSLSVDKDAIYLSTKNSSPFGATVSLYTIPKSDLFLTFPTLTNMSRFERLEGYGTSVQVAINFEDSDGKATLLGNVGPGFVSIADIVGADAPGATLSEPEVINTAVNVGPIDLPLPVIAPSQTDPAGIPLDVNPDITGSIYEWQGRLWGVQAVTSNFDLFPFQQPDTSGDFQHGILWFEIDVNEKILVEGERGPNAHVIWATNTDTFRQTFFNPSIAVNEYGVLAIQFNNTTYDFDADADDPVGLGEFIGTTLVTGIKTNGLNRGAVYIDTPTQIQPGLEDFDPNPVGGPHAWGNSTDIRVGPNGDMWAISSFANQGDRWSTNIAKFNPIELTAYLEANDLDNDIVISVFDENPALIEITIDGDRTDLLPISALGRLNIMGHRGADHFLIDYTNGDPIPTVDPANTDPSGLGLDGGFGFDVVETNDPNGGTFVIDKFDHPDYGVDYPTRLYPFILLEPDPRPLPIEDDSFLAAPDGTYNEFSEVIDIEALWGGPGDDSFRFEAGYMLGSALGRGGDDTFEFASTLIGDVTGDFLPEWNGGIGESVNGGTGFNTLDFTDLGANAQIEVLGVSEFDGFDGRTLNSPVPTTFHLNDGPIGGDNPTDQWRHISYVIGSNNTEDQLFGLDSPTVVTVDDENSTYEADGGVMGFWQWENVHASESADLFNVISNTMNPIRLFGLGGDDVYNIGLNQITDNIGGLIFAHAGSGANQMFASNRLGAASDVTVLAQRISGLGEVVYDAVGGTFDLDLESSLLDDFIRVHSFDPDNTLVFRALSGNDFFSIEDLSKASVQLYGGEGDDTYLVERIQDVDFRNLEIFDSINAENDLLTLGGSILDETWIIDSTTFEDLTVAFEGIERVGIDGRGGDDTFHVRAIDFDLFIDGGDGDDVFNFSSDAPAVFGTTENITGTVEIEAGTGTNALTVSNRSGPIHGEIFVDYESIIGLLPSELIFRATGGNFAQVNTGRLTGIRLYGANRFNDVFNVDGLYADNDLSIWGLAGADRFRVQAEAEGDVVVDGGNDSDIYQVWFVGNGDREVTINDFGLRGLNRAEFYGNDSDETIALSNFEVERFEERAFLNGDYSFIGLHSFGGNDQLSISNSLATTNRVMAGDGDDTITISGTDDVVGLQLFGEGGHDDFFFLDVDVNTFTRALGGDGSDTYFVRPAALGNLVLDGENGPDTYNVDLVGSGDRYVDTRDSGTIGFDSTVITGTSGANDINIRAQNVFADSERIVYDSNSERLTVDAGNGNDTVSMWASEASGTFIFGNFGQDEINVHSTGNTNNLQIDSGSGDDDILVKSTASLSSTTIDAKEGDDTIYIGSTPDLFGKLGRIRGFVSIIGGENSFAGEDKIMVNDKGTTGGPQYRIAPNLISHLVGPAIDGTLLFAGIAYDSSIEVVSMSGSNFANRFTLIPSQDTRYFIDGGSPGNSMSTKDAISIQQSGLNGAQLNITDQAFGEGFWEFTDGSQIIEFVDIEANFAS